MSTFSALLPITPVQRFPTRASKFSLNEVMATIGCRNRLPEEPIFPIIIFVSLFRKLRRLFGKG